MFKNKRWMVFMAGVLVFTTCFPMTAEAAARKQETRVPVETVTINVESAVREGDMSGYIMITKDSDSYSVGNYEWSGMKNEEGWQIGDKPKVKISLHARAGYYFNKTNGKGKVTVYGADYNSARIADNKETLIITVTLPTVAGKYDKPDDAWWDDDYSNGNARWEAIKGISAYELVLYRDGNKICELEKVIGTSYDFYPYMVQEGTYVFHVRGIPKDSEEASYIWPTAWTKSDGLRLKSRETPDRRYGWYAASKGGKRPVHGWQKSDGGWWFQEEDGTYPSNTWKEIDGKWYLFDPAGYMLTGWQKWQGHQYVLSEDGAMRTGWVWDNRNWYYFGNDGAAVTGWNNIDGKIYYMNDRYAALSGWWLLDGKWHYFDTSTRQMLHDAWIDGYYVDSSGVWKP